MKLPIPTVIVNMQAASVLLVDSLWHETIPLARLPLLIAHYRSMTHRSGRPSTHHRRVARSLEDALLALRAGQA